MLIPTNNVIPNPEQPRTHFDPDELKELACSIREHGLLQAIVVEDAGDGTYILIDGERRWRACNLIGQDTIEATIRPAMNGTGKQDRLVLALIANLQRVDNNPIEEARAFKKLRGMGISVEDIAQKIGRHPALVYSRLNLLDLEPEIQELVADGRLPSDNNFLANIKLIADPEKRVRVARSIAGKKLGRAQVQMICKRAAGDETVRTAHNYHTPRQSNDHWSALVLIGGPERLPGQVPTSELVKAVEKTCRQCALFEMASEKTCKDCPLVQLLEKIS